MIEYYQTQRAGIPPTWKCQFFDNLHTAERQKEKIVEASDKNTLWYRAGFLDDTPRVIYCIVAGDENKGSIVGYVGNVSGKIVEYDTGKVRSPNPGEDVNQGEDPFDTFFRKRFGKRPARIPFLQKVKPLTIDRVVIRSSAQLEAIQAERRNRGVDDRLTLDDYIESTTVPRYGLYEEILRPTKHRDFDTVDSIRFSVNSLTTLHVKDASPAYTVYQDNLLQTASSLISSYISSTILCHGYDEYRRRSNELTPGELEGLNRFLDQLGLVATKCVMTDPELNKEIQASMEEKAKAKNTADAKIEEARGIGGYKREIAQADADGIKAIAEAKARMIGAVADTFHSGGKGVDMAEAVRMADRHIVRNNTADAVGRLKGTIAHGGNASILSWNEHSEETETDDDVPGDTPATPAGNSTGVAGVSKPRKGRKDRRGSR